MARRWLDRTLFQRIPPTGRPVTPLRRREWRSRAATALCFAFYAGVGLTPVAAQMPPRMNEGAPAVVRDTSTQANSLAEKFSADLDPQVASKTDAILDQVSEQISAQANSLAEKFSADLDPQVASKTDAILDQVSEQISAQANSLAEKFSADLDAQVASKTDAILDQVSEQMSAQLLRRLEQNIATRLEPPTSTAKPMLSIVIRPDSEEEVSEPEGKPLELAEQPA